MFKEMLRKRVGRIRNLTGLVEVCLLMGFTRTYLNAFHQVHQEFVFITDISSLMFVIFDLGVAEVAKLSRLTVCIIPTLMVRTCPTVLWTATQDWVNN